MKTFYLNGTWKMNGNGYAVEGAVPGSVFSFLHLDNGLLPDPHYRDNEQLYLDASEHEYTFSRTFDFTPTGNPVRLVFEGLDTLCTVYLNGEKVADTDNMHVRYDFDVSGLLQQGENLLAVVCHPVNPYMKDLNAKGRLFGATDCMEGYPYVRKAHCMMGWDWGPRLPDAGIWRNVYLLEKDSAEILDFHVTQRHENGRVYLTPSVLLDGDGEVEISLCAPDGTASLLTANEENEVENPLLWWPNGMGEQPLYTVTATVKAQGETADEKTLKIGLRTLELVREKDDFGEGFYHKVNGVDMFAMGADYIPEDTIFSRITPERTRELLTHCRDCNFNAIRVWGGGYYPDDFFFDICDELGLVVFFDLMFACSVYDPDEKMYASIEREILQNVTRIRHHACLGLICGNNEIEWHFHDYVAISGRQDVKHLEGVYLRLFEDMLPSLVEKVAPYVKYIPSSPTSVGGFRDPNGEGYGDCHDWEPDYLVTRNRFYRYVSEFGFQSLPCLKTVESFTEPGDRNAHSRIMDMHQRSFGGNELIFNYLTKNYLYPNDFATYLYATQVLQAEAVKYKVEHFRRNRGRCMGTLYWQLNDVWQGTSWSSIDYCGRYKVLQYAAKRFYAPVLLSCEEVGETQNRRSVNMERGVFKKGQSVQLCVTNDTMYEVNGQIRWELRNAESDILRSGEESVSVAPLSVTRLERKYLAGFDPQATHMSFSLTVDGKVVSQGSVLFTQAKYYDFQNPNLRAEISDGEITVYSDAYAKSVWIEGVDGDLILEDNGFDMEKGCRKVRILSGSATKLSLKSVYDIR